MKALILNSGLGTRMGVLASEHPKCMTEISPTETILGRQIKQISETGISEVIITIGPFEEALKAYCQSLDLPLKITFVKNPLFAETNYIYSIYCARDYLNDDILLMHGDLVFENSVLDAILSCEGSCMAVNSVLSSSDKDFKCTTKNGYISRISVGKLTDAISAQPLYKLNRSDWSVWLSEIVNFCENGKVNCYAENAFNEASERCRLKALDVGDKLCSEIDNPEDLRIVFAKLKEVESRLVYMCFSTDIIHSGHINIIKKARRLGRLLIGVLSDEAVVSYKRFPLLPFEERKVMFENIAGVYKVIEQKTLSYKENLERYHPSYVVHGDDWRSGLQKPIRDETLSILESYGGKLIEYPYNNQKKYLELEKRARIELGTPDARRSRLRKLLAIKKPVTALEAHSGLTGLIVENTRVEENGGVRQFDAMWISSLCDSTDKGKPDIELVDMTSRFRTINDICEVTTKPIIFDGDTGGLTDHFVYTVRSLERMGVSMVIIEDKTGLKKNSLFGNEVPQTQDSIEHFCKKISAGKKAQRTGDFMICARIESLILEKGMDDAVNRAFAYVKAGADAIMIHSRKKDPAEIFEFVDKFRVKDPVTPLVVVPTSFNIVTEEEFKACKVDIVIYANQLTRAEFPAMQNAAEMILKYHRAKECDDICMPFKDIIRLIPEE